ncbi:MAG TPA: response regulator [Verrucomicrobiae bacterium]|nr:response regulator [Verrucomicrobiae bacterium]
MPGLELIRDNSPSEARRGLRILVVDDNAINQNLAVLLVKKQGHSAVVANNGREALELLEKEVFDLVLMDVQMPEIDGVEATMRLREKEQQKGLGHLPVIALTAHAMAGDRERCLAAGMDGYVTKPVRVKELFAAIDDIAARLIP